MIPNELLDGNASIDPNADTLHAGEAFGGTHMWLGIDVGGKVLQGLGSCLFPDLAVHMATGPAAQYSAVCPDGLVTGLRVLSRQDLAVHRQDLALHMATGQEARKAKVCTDDLICVVTGEQLMRLKRRTV